MIILINTLILLLLGIGFVSWKHYQSWLKTSQNQAQQLAKNEVLLRQLTQEQDRWLEKTSTALHSNLKSKIHAIDLALYRLKKQVPSVQVQGSFSDISTATASSLQLIDELGCSIVSPTLYTLGFLPALRELAGHFDATIHIHVPDTAVLQFSANTASSLYALIKLWLEQSVDVHVASEIFINWQQTDKQWTLVYQDNGQYDADAKDLPLELLLRLSELDAKIQQYEVALSGRTITLVANC